MQYHSPNIKSYSSTVLIVASIPPSLGIIFSAGIACILAILSINPSNPAFVRTAKNGRTGMMSA